VWLHIILCFIIIHGAHSVIHSKYFSQKHCNGENGVYTLESKQNILVNVTIRWGYMRRHAHTFHMQTSMCWQPHSLIYVLISSTLHCALNSGTKGLMDVVTVL